MLYKTHKAVKHQDKKKSCTNAQEQASIVPRTFNWQEAKVGSQSDLDARECNRVGSKGGKHHLYKPESIFPPSHMLILPEYRAVNFKF